MGRRERALVGRHTKRRAPGEAPLLGRPRAPTVFLSAHELPWRVRGSIVRFPSWTRLSRYLRGVQRTQKPVLFFSPRWLHCASSTPLASFVRGPATSRVHHDQRSGLCAYLRMQCPARSSEAAYAIDGSCRWLTPHGSATCMTLVSKLFSAPAWKQFRSFAAMQPPIGRSAP